MRGRVVHAPLDKRPPIRMLSSNRGCGNPHGPTNHRPEVDPLFGPPPDPPADRGGSGDRGSVFPLPPHRAGEDPLRAPSRDDRKGRLQGRGRPRDAGDLGAPRHPDAPAAGAALPDDRVPARARGPVRPARGDGRENLQGAARVTFHRVLTAEGVDRPAGEVEAEVAPRRRRARPDRTAPKERLQVHVLRRPGRDDRRAPTRRRLRSLPCRHPHLRRGPP